MISKNYKKDWQNLLVVLRFLKSVVQLKSKLKKEKTALMMLFMQPEQP